ncbi:MAG TPA: hypothetical protein VGE94_17710 [Chloroflexota bacterium]|jgi:hypothetical protein
MPTQFILLHGSVGLLDDGFMLAALLLAALAVLCVAGYAFQEWKAQPAPVSDADSSRPD